MNDKPTIRSEIFDRRHASQFRAKKQARQRRDSFVFGVLICITVALIVLSIRITKRTRVLSQKVARSEQRLRELLSMETDLREQPVQDRNAVDDFLQYCRSAEDIPDFESEHVIYREDFNRLLCYVPAGKHQLEISVYRLLKPTGPPQNQPVANKPKKEKRWMVSLRGDTGYLFKVTSNVEAHLLSWELSANHPEFESRKEIVATGDFEHVSQGFSIQQSPMFYPNQAQDSEMHLRASVYGTNLITEWEKSAATPPPVALFGDRWKSKTGNSAGAEIRIAVKLVSEGPTQVAASDAVKIIGLQRLDLLMPYKGGGKWELRAPK
jgi:hypothetical protein